jgi:ATP-dependent Clp protease adaptor protein ClpS
MSAYQEQSNPDASIEKIEENSLILYNDFNAIEHVIHCLINVVGQDPIQAEQCAFIVHYKGKYAVKKGSFESLQPMHLLLSQLGLTVSID